MKTYRKMVQSDLNVCDRYGFSEGQEMACCEGQNISVCIVCVSKVPETESIIVLEILNFGCEHFTPGIKTFFYRFFTRETLTY